MKRRQYMKKYLTAAIVFIVVLSVTAWSEDKLVLAKIGDQEITMEDFDRIIRYYDAEKQEMMKQNPIYKATILQRIVQGKVLSRIAREQGFDKKSHIQEQVEMLTNDFLAMQYLQHEIANNIEVTDDDMQLYYKTHEEEFVMPEMVHAGHILIRVAKTDDEEKKKRARTEAENILKRIKGGEDFGKLATEFSDDKGSRDKGGDLGFFPKGKTVPSFERAAFELKVGDVSDIVETSYGYHIIKVFEKREAGLKPYEKIKDKVRQKVLDVTKKTKIDEFTEKAMRDAGVELHLEPFLPKQ
jgi:peptidyl-prolyl cis-trans isomerase C